MAKTIQQNVTVEDKTYGPSYPDNDPTGVEIPEWAYEANPPEVGSGDYRFRADDFGEEDVPNLRAKAEQVAAEREAADAESRGAIFGGEAAEVAERAREAAKRTAERDPAAPGASEEAGKSRSARKRSE